jgi:hypothetical protein
LLQDTLQAAYTRELKEAFGITFNQLFTMTNMPIKRFADLLYKQGGPTPQGSTPPPGRNHSSRVAHL